MKPLFTVTLFLMIFVIACEKDSTAPEETNPPAPPTKSELSKFFIKQTYYDSLQVGSETEIVLEEQSVEQIIFGSIENGNFLPEDTLIPGYTPSGNHFFLLFQIDKQLNKNLRVYEFLLRFVLTNSDTIDVDTLAPTFKYPYESAEVFITTEEVAAAPIFFQDIDMNESDFFFHPTSAYGLYHYNFNSGSTTELVGYPSGNFIAHDSICVFYEIGWPSEIFRYNLQQDTTDLVIDLSTFTFDYINGLEIYNGILYALLYSTPSSFLAKFDLQGNFLETISYPKNTIFMTIKNDILYSIDPVKGSLSRFDLNTQTYLADRSLPTIEWEGIRIVGDNFYFVDFYKKMIGMIPLSELE